MKHKRRRLRRLLGWTALSLGAVLLLLILRAAVFSSDGIAVRFPVATPPFAFAVQVYPFGVTSALGQSDVNRIPGTPVPMFERISSDEYNRVRSRPGASLLDRLGMWGGFGRLTNRGWVVGIAVPHYLTLPILALTAFWGLRRKRPHPSAAFPITPTPPPDQNSLS